MSIIAPTPRLAWRVLPAVVVAAVTTISASLAIGSLRERPSPLIGPDDPALVQPIVAAEWDIDVIPVGKDGPLTPRQRDRLRIQKHKVGRVAGELADIVTLEPHRVPTHAGGLLTKPAAKAIRRALPGLPEGATEVTATKRRGEIGVQSPGFDAAAARMEIKMRARVNERTVRWTQGMTLWLERAGSKWRVLAFDIERIPGR